MSVLGHPTWAILTVLKLRFGYSGMRFQIRVNIQGSGTRISGYPLRTLVMMNSFDNYAPHCLSDSCVLYLQMISNNEQRLL